MCGIVAIHSPGGGLARRHVDPAIERLRHRGPDGSGRWVSPSGRAALGHTRLAIIDPQAGQQPMRTPDGRRHLVVSGEFYDYQELRAELVRRGAAFGSRSDSEVALHLLAMDGVGAAMPRLRGEFAFVLWDEARGELTAVRDRFGVKPLFYASHGGRLYLASEVKALLAAGVPARWDTGAVADHLLVCYPPGGSLFAGVRQLPPGCVLRAGAGGVHVEPYWDLDYPTEPDLPLPHTVDLAGHLRAVEEAVRDSVRTRMRADVPVAYHLSGGLDSATVVALAAQHGDAVPTFTVRFDEPDFDEGAAARRMAEHVGAKHTEVAFRTADVVDRIEDTIVCGEMLQENSHGAARMAQSAAIRAGGYKVVLAGEGGDEMFAGYPQSRKDLAYSLSPEVREMAARSYRKLLAQGAPHHLRALLDRLGFVPNWILDRYLSVTLPLGDVLAADFAAELHERDPFAWLFDGGPASAQLDGRSPYHQSMYLFCKTWLCNYLLAAERLDMANALEVRLPFLDHHVHSTVKRTPLAWYLRGERPKPVLREAMRPYLTEEVYAGGKRGFFASPAVADDRVLARLRAIVHRDTLDELPFFAPAKVRALLDHLTQLPPARRIQHERVVQLVTGMIVLTERFNLRS